MTRATCRGHASCVCSALMRGESAEAYKSIHGMHVLQTREIRNHCTPASPPELQISTRMARLRQLIRPYRACNL